MNQRRTNWGTSLWICDIYWGYTPLWTSPLASQCSKGKTDGPRSWHVWTLKHSGFMVLFMLFLNIWFTACSEVMAALFFLFFVLGKLNIYCHNFIVNFCKIAGSLLFCETPVLWSTDPLWKSLIYLLLKIYGLNTLLPCTEVAHSVWGEIPHTKAIDCFGVYVAGFFCFFLIPCPINQLVILRHVYFNRVKINEPQWLKQICKYRIVQFRGAGSPTDYL